LSTFYILFKFVTARVKCSSVTGLLKKGI